MADTSNLYINHSSFIDLYFFDIYLKIIFYRNFYSKIWWKLRQWSVMHTYTSAVISYDQRRESGGVIQYRYVRPEVTTQQIRDVEAMLVQCSVSVADGGRTLKRHWIKVLCFVICHVILYPGIVKSP